MLEAAGGGACCQAPPLPPPQQQTLSCGSCATDESQHLLPSADLAGVAALIASGRARSIVVLAGAGISVAAGIPDFRTPGTGEPNSDTHATRVTVAARLGQRLTQHHTVQACTASLSATTCHGRRLCLTSGSSGTTPRPSTTSPR